MTIYYDDLVVAGTAYRPSAFGQNEDAYADDLVLVAPFVETAAATAITLSGPSSGNYGAASANFTVGADGVITGTVIFTPTSSAGTGSFTPTTVSISSGTPTATFTYTPTSSGARNINGTNNGSLSAPSNVVYTANAVAPYTPAAPVATRGNAQASVVLVAPDNGGSAITGYTVVSSPGGGTDSNAGSTGLTHVVTGLPNGTPHTFTFTATNAIGTSSASPASNSVTPGTVPDAPTIGTATAGLGTAQVPYTAPASNGGLTITQYRAISTPGSITGTLSQAGSGTISVSDLDDIAYTFTVRATNDAGNSAESSASNSVTPEAPPAELESTTGVATVAGSTLAVSTAIPMTFDADGYAALDYTGIGEITDLGSGYGRMYSTTTRAPIDSAQVKQRKSFYTLPAIEMMMAWDQSDAGQDLLRTASNNRSTVTFKLTIQDGDIRYFTAEVSRFVENHGTVDNLRQGALTLLMQSDIVAYPA